MGKSAEYAYPVSGSKVSRRLGKNVSMAQPTKSLLSVSRSSLLNFSREVGRHVSTPHAQHTCQPPTKSCAYHRKIHALGWELPSNLMSVRCLVNLSQLSLLPEDLQLLGLLSSPSLEGQRARARRPLEGGPAPAPGPPRLAAHRLSRPARCPLRCSALPPHGWQVCLAAAQGWLTLPVAALWACCNGPGNCDGRPCPAGPALHLGVQHLQLIPLGLAWLLVHHQAGGSALQSPPDCCPARCARCQYIEEPPEQVSLAGHLMQLARAAAQTSSNSCPLPILPHSL
jgi:hypothetical protein